MSLDTSCPQDIECCGRVYVVRRELRIAKRLEASLGPARALSERLDTGGATIHEVTSVYAMCLEGQADVPDRAEIEAWVFATGTLSAARQIAWFVFSLVVGNDDAARIHDKLLVSATKARAEASEHRRPFVPTDASTSPGLSTSQR